MDTDAPHAPSPARTLRLELATVRRSIRRYGLRPHRVAGSLDERAVFVVGSPRSGTTFIAEAIGRVPGFADLGEVNLLKASVPYLLSLAPQDAARRVRRMLVRSQRLGLVAGMRPVEQTPESTFLMPVLAMAFPRARFVHMVRDARDVACSLIERGWLRDGVAGAAVARATGTTHDDAGQPFGDYARFWVEPARRREFGDVTEARRAAWAWRRYNQAALDGATAVPAGAVLRVRYEQMAAHPDDVAADMAAFLDADTQHDAFRCEIATVHDRSSGRWRNDLDDSQVADVEAEAGDLLRRFDYAR